MIATHHRFVPPFPSWREISTTHI
uniref:Uncharacterized protein n=1 Tax=Ralstonia solanacearum TaxID=305 RepID=A0A0S4U8C4_RALSL|nr:protein of unknown function [Ralstonia solanacearum]